MANTLTKFDIRPCFPARPKEAHKGTFGKCVLFAGSTQFPGAAYLSEIASAAMRMGCGYSILAVPSTLSLAYSQRIVEGILSLQADDGNGNFVFDEECICSAIEDVSSVAVGMGMGKSEEVSKLISFLLSDFKGVLLIDADGLNCFDDLCFERLKTTQADVILTPHPGEFSRLIRKDIPEALSERERLVREFTKEYPCALLLKGATTLIAKGETVLKNERGTPAMAKAGSGDVLSGAIVGIAARGFDAFSSACAGAYICGVAGELASKELSEHCALASDTVRFLPYAVKNLLVD